MSRNPQLNASLIREGRMIFQQLQEIFGNGRRVDNVFAMKAAQAQAEADIAKAKAQAQAPALKCEPCLRSGAAEPAPAITVSRGFAVCRNHLVSVNNQTS